MGLYRVRFGAGPLGLQVSPASRGAEGWCRGLVVTGGARAGVRPGDEIVSVNDVDLSGFASDTALAIVAAAADRELTFRHFEEDAYQTGAVEAVCRFEHRGPDFVAFFPDGRVGMTLLPRNADGERCGGLVVDDLAGSKAPIGLQQGDGLRSVNRVPLATFPFSIALEIFRVASARCCVVERSQPNARAHAEPAAVELATAEPVTSAPRPRRDSQPEPDQASSSSLSNSQSPRARPRREKHSTRKTRLSPRKFQPPASPLADADQEEEAAASAMPFVTSPRRQEDRGIDDGADYDDAASEGRDGDRLTATPTTDYGAAFVPPPPTTDYGAFVAPPPRLPRRHDAENGLGLRDATRPLSPPPREIFESEHWRPPRAPEPFYRGVPVRGRDARGRVEGWHLVSQQLMDSLDASAAEKRCLDDREPPLHVKLKDLYDAVPPPRSVADCL